jgi:hypothetical protein
MARAACGPARAGRRSGRARGLLPPASGCAAAASSRACPPPPRCRGGRPDLGLDVARAVEELLQKALAPAEGRDGLAHRRFIQLGYFVHLRTRSSCPRPPPPNAALMMTGRPCCSAKASTSLASSPARPCRRPAVRPPAARSCAPPPCRPAGRWWRGAGRSRPGPRRSRRAQRRRARRGSRSPGARRRRRFFWRCPAAFRRSR